ncbi:MAG: polymer-forming cytoskeletal protein [Candidatus Zixiibacteriota bacterium]|nr:MAG: polymer-forming cytoskeletal protein [candidate division Zixibacteria bacterium]
MRIPPVGTQVLFASVLLLSASVAVSRAQDEAGEYAPSDTVFNEITLTADGVAAVDTAGYDWYYDFDRGVFVVGIPGDGEDVEAPEAPDELGDVYAPVEERDSREVKVKPVVQRIVIDYDEYVDGNIIALGRVTIRGWVKGDVTSINNRVLIAGGGRVDGDVTASEIVVKPGGQILGERVIVDIDPGDYIPPPGSDVGMILIVIFTSVFLFFGFLIVTLLPRQTANFKTCLSENRLKAYLIGLFFMLLMPFILVLVAITIVGVVLLPFVPFVYLFAILLGVVAFGEDVGRVVLARFEGPGSNVLLRSMVGILAFMALWFLTAALLRASADVARGFGVFFLVVSIVLSTYPILTGVGGAVMTRFGFKVYIPWKERQRRAGATVTPAPPPIPKTPPEPTPGVFDGENEDETSGPAGS